jgi:hypothetical protein
MMLQLRMQQQMKRTVIWKNILLGTASIVVFFGGEEMDNYETQRETFSSNSGPQNSAMNVNENLSVFLFFLLEA